jgi:acyl dehydratase
MPIDPAVAIGADLPAREVSWGRTDVLLYHLALGAHTGEPHYVFERDLRVLPTFAVVAGTLRDTAPPRIAMPGIDVDLVDALHGRQELTIHRLLPPEGRAVARARIVDVQDKGHAAIIVTESRTPWFTNRVSVYVRGAGGFGGARGRSTRGSAPEGGPDAVLLTPTSTEQALWYRLCGDLNPLHVDPGFAAAAGFPRPILHGLCTYGMVCKAVVDGLLDGDPGRVAGYDARFTGVVYPGETLRTRVWRGDGVVRLSTTVVERDDAPALGDATITLTR